MYCFVLPWEQRKLGELTNSFEYGLNASAKKFDGIHKYIRITDIDDSSRKFNSDSITSPDIDFSSADNYELKLNDLLFARTGASVGKSYIYTESDGLVYYAGFLIRVRIKPEFDSNFVFQNTFTSTYENFIRITSQRSGQPGVNAKEYAGFEINIPSLEEQQMIGSLFKQLDNLTAQNEQKVDLLKQLKQAYLQQIFSQELRFAGFSDDWEQRKLGEYVNFLNGRAYKQTELLDKGRYRVLRVGNFNTNDRWYYSDLELEQHKYANKGDLLYLWATNFGPEIWNEEKVIYHYHIWKLELLNNNLNKQYLYTWLMTDKERIKQNTNGTTMVHVTKRNMEQRDFQFPSIEEQIKVGSFFKQLDNLITLNQQKLNLLKKQKQAFLKKMFI
ncbi:restriction endonuclease subunit S [Leuconostoc falkenbergense]